MKKLALVLVALTFYSCSTTLPPAGPSKDPMKKADAIYINTSDAPKDSYKKIAQIITDRGFTINNSDPSLLMIDTKFKEQDLSGLMGFNMSIHASIRDSEDYNSTIKLTAKWTRGGSSEKEIYNESSKLDVRNKGWNILLDIAESYNGEEITYSRN